MLFAGMVPGEVWEEQQYHFSLKALQAIKNGLYLLWPTSVMDLCVHLLHVPCWSQPFSPVAETSILHVGGKAVNSTAHQTT